MAAPIKTLKLRVHEAHARIVPTRDERGAPFDEPGVDAHGEHARAMVALAGPLFAWLEAREPGVVVRVVMLDLERRRAVVTLEAAPRPRVVTLVGASFEDFLTGAPALLDAASDVADRALRARRA